MGNEKTISVRVSGFKMIKFKKIDYRKLKSRQQENYNYQKISSALAEYGFSTIKLSDDWQTADFIAQHIDQQTFLKVQLKGRPYIHKKYMGKDLWICFRFKEHFYLYPHDEVAKYILANFNVKNTASWKKKGGYGWKKTPQKLLNFLEKYKFS